MAGWEGARRPGQSHPVAMWLVFTALLIFRWAHILWFTKGLLWKGCSTGFVRICVDVQMRGPAFSVVHEPM